MRNNNYSLIVYTMTIIPPNWVPYFERKYFAKMQRKLFKKFVNNQIDSVDIIVYLIKNVPAIKKLYIKEYVSNAKPIIDSSIKQNICSKYKRRFPVV